MSATKPIKPIKPIGIATAGQLVASNPTRSVWVSANAGTGKTRVLVDRIARLLLSGVAPQKILCLTFTKTGAAEMAERINKRLGRWVVMNDDELILELTSLIQNKPDDDVIKRARALFAQVLETPGGLKIRTIHSFAESLLARFPLEANIAPHFTVIDERTAAEFMTTARDNVLETAYKKKSSVVAKAMHHLAELINEEGFVKLMHELTSARTNLNHVLKFYGDGLDSGLVEMVGLNVDEATIEKIIANAVKDGAFNKNELLRAATALSHGAAGSKKMSVTLISWLDQSEASKAESFLSVYVPLFIKKDGGAKAESKLITKDAKEFDPDALDILLAEQARIIDTLDKIKRAQTANATRALLTVGKAIQDEFEILKRASGGLDYDDLIEKACNLLADEDGASWVHFKLDGGIDHILVDESQDTSPEQWLVVKGLAADFFSGSGQAEENVRTVFAVGDEKQSIYSFQGADPYEFERMREYFEKRVTDAKGEFTPLQLTTSFRSTRAVLAIVDRVFAGSDASDGLSFADKKVLHESSRTGEAGLVELWPAQLPESRSESDPWDAPLDRLSLKSPETKVAERIALTIKGWLDRAEILKSKGRAIRPDDILILVRRRGAFADEMVRQLKLNNIDVAGSDRMVLTDQIAVEDLMALGNFCLLPEDDLNTAALLKSPLIGLNEDELLKLASGRKNTIWGELKKFSKKDGSYKNAYQILSGHLGRADYQPPYEFFADVLTRGGRKQLVERLGSDAHDPLDEFLSLALQFERTHTPSLQGFLYWVGSGATQIKRDMEITGSKVRVMTVHGAKGLEANIVFLPDTCAKPAHQHDNKIQWDLEDPGNMNKKPLVLWSPAKEMRPELVDKMVEQSRLVREREYRRLLYVAMTRAADRLYVCGYAPEKGPADGSWYQMAEGPIKERGEEIKTKDGNIWRYETKQDVKVTKQEIDSKSKIATLPGWASLPPADEQIPPKPLVPSVIQPDDSALGPFAGDGALGLSRGIAVHKLLEILPALKPDARKDAGLHWLNKSGLGLDKKDQKEILTETIAVLENKDLKPLFTSGAIAEAAIVGRVGDHVVSGRIDRLVVGDDEVMIIDYKTNRRAPKTSDGVSPAYKRQMAIYRALLREVYPDRPIRCFLLWTEGPRTMELDPAQLDAITL